MRLFPFFSILFQCQTTLESFICLHMYFTQRRLLFFALRILVFTSHKYKKRCYNVVRFGVIFLIKNITFLKNAKTLFLIGKDMFYNSTTELIFFKEIFNLCSFLKKIFVNQYTTIQLSVLFFAKKLIFFCFVNC